MANKKIKGIHKAAFLMSNSDVKSCPEEQKPEYAFMGRSNVGKSSLINMLTNNKGLAKTSGTPGKTRLINHFLVNEEWLLVDLPGFGYAKISQSERDKWKKMINAYLLRRDNLVCTFILVDIRHEPQKIDLEFMGWMSEHQLPFVIAFTKADKLSKRQLQESLKRYSDALLESWEELPTYFVTSAETAAGKEEIIKFINDNNKLYFDYINSLEKEA